MEKIENKWILPSQSDDELKTIAKDMYNNLIFSDKHLSQYDNVMSHFMVLMFMGPKEPEAPSYPSKDGDLQGQRDNKLLQRIYK